MKCSIHSSIYKPANVGEYLKICQQVNDSLQLLWDHLIINTMIMNWQSRLILSTPPLSRNIFEMLLFRSFFYRISTPRDPAQNYSINVFSVLPLSKTTVSKVFITKFITQPHFILTWKKSRIEGIHSFPST